MLRDDLTRVLDLGGVRPGVNQVIDLDRMNLTDGTVYEFQLFYAHRQGNAARFDEDHLVGLTSFWQSFGDVRTTDDVIENLLKPAADSVAAQ